jgi:thiol:disulfide interchange protein DsbG
MLRRFISAIASSLLLCGLGFAANAPTIAQQGTSFNIPSVLSVPMRGGLSIIKRFQGPSGLTGWIMKDQNGSYYPMFTTADGKVLISGALINTHGENLSRMYENLYAPKVSLTKLWAQFQKSTYIIEGPKTHPKHVIYAVMDPNCIFCHLFWLAIHPYVKAGLQVRWVPVGFLKPSSLNKAAEILMKGEPALVKDERNFNVKSESGSITGMPPSAKVSQELSANFALMKAALVRGTPGIFYKNKNGIVLRHVGMPMISELPAITGMPAQKETNKELNQFLKRLSL